MSVKPVPLGRHHQDISILDKLISDAAQQLCAEIDREFLLMEKLRWVGFKEEEVKLILTDKREVQQ